MFHVSPSPNVGTRETDQQVSVGLLTGVLTARQCRRRQPEIRRASQSSRLALEAFNDSLDNRSAPGKSDGRES
jgi:hypothetical protein